MKSFLKLFFIVSLTFINSFGSSFLCTNEPVVKDYLNAVTSDISGATKYANQASCETSCKTIQSCSYSSNDLTNFTIFSPSKFLDEATASSTLNYLKNYKVSNFNITKDGVYVTVAPTNQSLFQNISFPSNPDVGTPKKTLTFNVGDNTVLKISKLFLPVASEQSYTGTDISLSQINSLINSSSPGDDGFGVKYIAIDGNKFDFPMNGSLISQVDFNISSTTLYANGTDYIKFKQTSISGSLQNSIEYKKDGIVKTIFNDSNSHTINFGTSKYDTSTIWTAFDFTVSGISYNMEDGVFLDATNTIMNHWVSLSATLKNNGYVCPMYSGDTDIGGDLNLNLFSTKTSCDLKCTQQFGCIEWAPSNCTLTGSLESSPVTDYTGKNVNTKKTYSWKCSKTNSILERCDAYAYTQNDGKLNYALSGAGWETKDETAAFSQAVAGSYMVEQLQHIWSGWEGYCENGTKYDSSWMSDPMQLMQFAMMAYSQFDLGNTAAVQSVKEGVQAAAVDVGRELGGGYNAWGMVPTDVATGGQSLMSGAVDTFNSYNNSIELFTGIPVTFTDLAGVALAAIGDVQNNDVQTADNYFQALLGASSGTSEAVRFANCMASIGLSFPNMMAYSVDSNETSTQLKNPSQNPLRLTYDEYAKIIAVVGPVYVINNYKVIEDSPTDKMLTIISKTGAAVTQAGEIVCAEDPAKAAALIQMQKIPEDTGGTSKGDAVANAAIQMALSKLPPPYGFFAAVAFKVLTSFSNGDACSSEKIATQWGPGQLRTNKALKGSQCHNTKNDCVKKWFWGSCMLKGSWYCCYDQEITRIFVEGIKEELNKGWGSCNDLTIYDLKNISFRPCEVSETPANNKCFPSGKYNELVNTVMKNATKNLSPDTIAKQASSGLTLPGKDPWAQ